MTVVAIRDPSETSYFQKMSGRARHLGSDWPDGATARYGDNYLVWSEGSDAEARVIRRMTILDAMREAKELSGRFGNGSVAKLVGDWGGQAIYQDVVSMSEDSPDLQRPANGDWFHWRKAHDPQFAKAYHTDLALKLHRKTTSSELIIEGFASTPHVDRDFDVVRPDAFTASFPKYLEENPILLFNHNPDRPVGSVIDGQIQDKGVAVVGRVDDDFVGFHVRKGNLRTFSTSFIMEDSREEPSKSPGGFPVREITKADMLENSIVSIPCQRNALFSVVKSIGNGKAYSIPKSVVPMQRDEHEIQAKRHSSVIDGPLREERRGLSQADRGDLHAAAFHDRFVFRHHSIDGEGLGIHPDEVLRGMAQLLSYAGEAADLTEDARASAYAHLAVHFKDLWPDQDIPTLPQGPDQDLVGVLLKGAGLRSKIAGKAGAEWTTFFELDPEANLMVYVERKDEVEAPNQEAEASPEASSEATQDSDSAEATGPTSREQTDAASDGESDKTPVAGDDEVEVGLSEISQVESLRDKLSAGEEVEMRELVDSISTANSLLGKDTAMDLLDSFMGMMDDESALQLAENVSDQLGITIDVAVEDDANNGDSSRSAE